MLKNPRPTRMCSGCMIRRPKDELTRIVRLSDGKAIIDIEQKLEGRGVYVCLSEECILKAQKKNKFSRALKGDVDKTIYEELKILANRE